MMKQNLLLFALLCSVLVIGCSDDDSNEDNNDETATIDCADIAATTQSAAEAYNATKSEETCKRYKEAINSQITSCGDELGVLQAIADGLGDCIEQPSKKTISVSVGSLLKTFDQNVTIDQNGTALTIRAEEKNSNNWVSIELEASATGTDILTDFTIFIISREYKPNTEFEPDPFTSTITVNSNEKIEGNFHGVVTAANNASVSLTGGTIDLTL